MTQEETRQQAIKEYLVGDVSLRTLAGRYKCPHTRIYRWIMAEKEEKKKRELLNPPPVVKVPLPELGSMSTDVGWLQEELRMSMIRVLLLEATIDISDEQFGTDMRKKVGTRQS
jgi:transposase-like protein